MKKDMTMAIKNELHAQAHRSRATAAPGNSPGANRTDG